MHRTFTTRRYLTSALLLGAAGSSFIACIPFDTEEEYIPPMNGGTEVVSAAKPPPPISGGTLVVSGKTAIAADSDRDLVWIVDLDTKAIAQVALQDGDEPGRVALDGDGRAHVALRRGGDVVTIDVASAKIVDRQEVCPAPRGLAYDKAQDLIHVACEGGQLVSLPAKGGEAVRTLHLDGDLRDVIVQGDRLLVSRFRSAELMSVSAAGAVTQRATPPKFTMSEQEFEPDVAWKTVGMPNGSIAMVHQRAMRTPVVIEQDGYGSGGCDGSIVHSAITVFPGGDLQQASTVAMPAIPFAILPVDVAVANDADQMAMVAAGSKVVVRTSRSGLESEAQPNPDFASGCAAQQFPIPIDAQPVAVAFDDSDQMIVQTREPASLIVFAPGAGTGASIALPGASVKDSGHEMFHMNPGGMSSMACASCHPEGREDGRTWNFNPIGARRTQFIGGGILDTAPLHWDGDMGGLDAIMAEVFVKRMGGLAQGPRRIKAFAKWLNALPTVPSAPPSDMQAVDRGKVLFNDPKVGCASCHSGAKFTNNKNADVGTGAAFQVPSLVNVAHRAPYMHDGCAATLKDRFSPYCGGADKHGTTSQLSPSDIDDLVAYLETL